MPDLTREQHARGWRHERGGATLRMTGRFIRVKREVSFDEGDTDPPMWVVRLSGGDKLWSDEPGKEIGRYALWNDAINAATATAELMEDEP